MVDRAVGHEFVAQEPVALVQKQGAELLTRLFSQRYANICEQGRPTGDHRPFRGFSPDKTFAENTEQLQIGQRHGTQAADAGQFRYIGGSDGGDVAEPVEQGIHGGGGGLPQASAEQKRQKGAVVEVRKRTRVGRTPHWVNCGFEVRKRSHGGLQQGSQSERSRPPFLSPRQPASRSQRIGPSWMDEMVAHPPHSRLARDRPCRSLRGAAARPPGTGLLRAGPLRR